MWNILRKEIQTFSWSYTKYFYTVSTAGLTWYRRTFRRTVISTCRPTPAVHLITAWPWPLTFDRTVMHAEVRLRSWHGLHVYQVCVDSSSVFFSKRGHRQTQKSTPSSTHIECTVNLIKLESMVSGIWLHRLTDRQTDKHSRLSQLSQFIQCCISQNSKTAKIKTKPSTCHVFSDYSVSSGGSMNWAPWPSKGLQRWGTRGPSSGYHSARLHIALKIQNQQNFPGRCVNSWTAFAESYERCLQAAQA